MNQDTIKSECPLEALVICKGQFPPLMIRLVKKQQSAQLLTNVHRKSCILRMNFSNVSLRPFGGLGLISI